MRRAARDCAPFAIANFKDSALLVSRRFTQQSLQYDKSIGAPSEKMHKAATSLKAATETDAAVEAVEDAAVEAADYIDREKQSDWPSTRVV